LRLLPVLEVLEIVDKAGVLHIAPLGQEVKVVGVTQALHKLHLYLNSTTATSTRKIN